MPNRQETWSNRNIARREPKNAIDAAPEQPQHHGKLYAISEAVAKISASVDYLEETGRQTRSDLKSEASLIRTALSELASQIKTDFRDVDDLFRVHDGRLDALERILAEQAAEARGLRRAMRLGVGALSMLGGLLGWMLATWGGPILDALKLAGQAGG